MRAAALFFLAALGACASAPGGSALPWDGLDVQAAEAEFGRRFETGDGVPVDLGRAAALYRRAATAIPPHAVSYAPPLRQGGTGRVLATRSPRSSRGSAEAQYRLGMMYLEGRGVPRDRAIARRLMKQAAGQGHADAIASLGRIPR